MTEDDLALQRRMENELINKFPDIVLLPEEMTINVQEVP